MNTSMISSLGFRRIATISPITSVANVDANVADILRRCDEATEQGAEVILLPELAITGYTVGDLVRVPDLLASALAGLDEICKWTAGKVPLVIVGLPVEIGSRLYNAAAVIHNGQVHAVVPKTYLPSTNEYYEHRWFVSGDDATTDTVEINGSTVPFGTDILIEDVIDPSFMMGVEICEDLWAVEPPSGAMARSGATLIVNPSASNEIVSKHEYRRQLVSSQSARTLAAYAYASSGPMESTTDTVFSGHCLTCEVGTVLGETRRLQMDGAMAICDVDLSRCVTERLHSNTFTQRRVGKTFRVISVELPRSIKDDIRRPLRPNPFVPPVGPDMSDRCREVLALQATSLATRIRHVGAKKMVVGLSGGLDSTLATLVCVEACDILGIDHSSVLAVSMPGFGTTGRTKTNAERLASTLGIEYREISIEESVRLHFKDIGHDESDTSVVFENAQARERTQILMDIANGVHGLVIGTGDMSELALGWCTYNADHMSMYAVNAGVPKTLVKHLVSWHADEHCSPEASAVLRDIVKTPISPELLPPGEADKIVQRTEDVLGPYEVHDFFLYQFVRMQRRIRSIAILAVVAFDGQYSADDITKWLELFVRRFFTQQFKRSCMPDGVKIGTVALSPRADWRMPSDAHADLWLNEVYRIRQEMGFTTT